MSRFKEKKAQLLKLAEERMDLCRSCPHYNDLGLCMKCKCIMRLKTKISNAKCPIGRW